MKTIECFRVTCLLLQIGSVLGMLLATTVPVALAGPTDEAEQIASLARSHGGLASIGA